MKKKAPPIDLDNTKTVTIIPFETIDAQLDSPRAQVNSGVFVAPLAKSGTKDFATVQIEPETTHGPFLLESGCMLGRVFTAPASGFRIKVEGEDFRELSSNDYFAIPEGACYTMENTDRSEPVVISIQLRVVMSTE